MAKPNINSLVDDVFVHILAELTLEERFSGFGAVCTRFWAIAHRAPLPSLDLSREVGPFRDFKLLMQKFKKSTPAMVSAAEELEQKSQVAALFSALASSSAIATIDHLAVKELILGDVPLRALEILVEKFQNVEALIMDNLGVLPLPAAETRREVTLFLRLKRLRTLRFFPPPLSSGYVFHLPTQTLVSLTILSQGYRYQPVVPLAVMAQQIADCDKLKLLCVDFDVPFGGLSNLESLEIQRCQSYSVKELESNEFKKLTQLTLSYSEYQKLLKLNDISHLTALESLELKTFEVVNSPSLSRLKKISFYECAYGTLAKFKDCPIDSIWIKHPSHWNPIPEEFRALTLFKSLTFLCIDDEVRNEYVPYLTQILPRLEGFIMDHSFRLKLNTLLSSFDSEKLKFLHLRRVEIDAAGMELISELEGLQDLEIGFSHNAAIQNDDDWISGLCDLPNLEKLKIVEESHGSYAKGKPCLISMMALEGVFEDMPKLKSVKLELHLQPFDESDIKRLRSIIPKSAKVTIVNRKDH